MSWSHVEPSKAVACTDNNLKLRGESDNTNQCKLKLNMQCVILLVCITNLFIILLLNGFISLDITDEAVFLKDPILKKTVTKSQVDVINFDWWSHMEFEVIHSKSKDFKNKLLVNTSGCQILYSSDIKFSRNWQLKNIPQCQELSFLISGREQIGPTLVESDSLSLWIVEQKLHHYNINDPKRIACCYRPFWRKKINQTGVSSNDEQSYATRCFRFNDTVIKLPIEKEIEFVEIKCYKKFGGDPYVRSLGNGKHEVKIHRDYIEEVYRDFHAFVPNKKVVEERCMKHPYKVDEVSVLILGIDAVSRLNMLRELPLLHSVLTSPPLSAISLLGYNKVGDNTFPNVMPILTGLAEEELKDACPWPSAKHKLDPCPFIWKDYANRGYRTASGEDAAKTSTFNFKYIGFSETPTDYYLKPFFYEAEKNIGHIKLNGSYLCSGSRFTLLKLLNYIEKFTTQFATKKSFGYFWTRPLSNNFTNAMKISDQLYSGFLNTLISRKNLDRTVFIVCSTGSRNIDNTYENEVAQNPPVFYISFPKKFRKRFPEAIQNIKLNAKNRLTSPFDIYKTLQDLLDPAKHINKNMLMAREMMLYTEKVPLNFSPNLLNYTLFDIKNNQRGISLFIPIPDNRTCKSAGIPASSCSCQSSIKIELSVSTTQHIAQYIVDQINLMLIQHPQCAQLHLADVLTASRSFTNEDARRNVSNEKFHVYYLSVKTNPGGYDFKAKVHVALDGNQRNTVKLQLLDQIKRINFEIFDINDCVFDADIKPFCNCI